MKTTVNNWKKLKKPLSFGITIGLKVKAGKNSAENKDILNKKICLLCKKYMKPLKNNQGQVTGHFQ